MDGILKILDSIATVSGGMVGLLSAPALLALSKNNKGAFRNYEKYVGTELNETSGKKEVITETKTGNIFTALKSEHEVNQAQRRVDLENDINNAKKVSEAYQDLANQKKSSAEVDRIVAEYTEKSTQAGKELIASLDKSKESFVEHDKQIEEHNKAQSKLIDSDKKYGDVAKRNLKERLNNLPKSLASGVGMIGGNIAAGLAIGVAMTAIEKSFSALDKKFLWTKQAKTDAMAKAVGDYSEANQAFSDNTATIKSLRAEFTSLSKGVSENGENIGLSADEYARYNEIVSELIAMNPSLIKGYTAQGNAIIDNNKAISDSIKHQQSLKDQAVKDYTSISSLKGIIAGVSVDQKETVKNLNSARDQIVNSLGFSSTSGASGLGKDVTNKDITAFSEEVNKALGDNVDLEHASVDTLAKIADKRALIMEYAEKSGKYDETSLNNLKSALSDLSSYSMDYEANVQPVVENLNMWAASLDSQLNESGKSLMSTVPAALQSGFQAGIKEIAGMDLTPGGMHTAVQDLASDLTKLYSGQEIDGVIAKYAKGTKTFEKFGKALDTNGDDAISYGEIITSTAQAQEDFNNSAHDSAAIDKYNNAIKNEVDILEHLAGKFDEAGNDVLAQSLRAQAASISSYAKESALDLQEAFNPLSGLIESATHAKEEFDAAMAGGDYNTAIDGYKEIYDTVSKDFDSGRNSKAFWQAADQMLGRDTIQELGGDYDKVKAALKSLSGTTDSTSKATSNFFEMLAANREELNEIEGVTIKENGGFDIDADKFDEVADALNVSTEYLTAMVNSARQWTNVDLSDTDAVEQTIKNMDTTMQDADGTSYQLWNNMSQQAQAAGLDLGEVYTKLGELEDSGKFKFIDLQSDDVNKTTDSLLQLNSALGEKNGSKYSMDANQVIATLQSMGATADETAQYLEKFEESGGQIKDGTSQKETGQTWADYVNKAFAVSSGDPMANMANSMDRIASLAERIAIAMGAIPTDFTIDSNIDSLSQQVENFSANGKDAEKQYNSLKKSLSKSYNEAKELKRIADNNGNADVSAKMQSRMNRLTASRLKLDITNGEDLSSINERLAQIKDKDVRVEVAADVADAIDGVEEVNGQLSKLPKDKEVTVESMVDYDLGDYPETVPDADGIANFLLGGSPNTVPNAGGLANFLLGGSPNTVPAASGLANFLLGSHPTAAPTIPGIAKYTGSYPSKAPTLSGVINYAIGKVTGKDKLPGQSASGTNNRRRPNLASGTNNRRRYGSAARGSGGRLGPRGKGGLTLTGELGPELIWLPDEDVSYLTGVHGPEMQDLPSNAVVWPYDETKRIMGDTVAPGQLNNLRGMGLSGLRQYQNGRYYFEDDKFGSLAKGNFGGKLFGSMADSNPNKTNNNGGGGGGGGGGDDDNNDPKKPKKPKKKPKKLSKDWFDWIEIKFDRIERKVKKLIDSAENEFLSFETRIKKFNQAIKQTKKNISTFSKGARRYLKRANSYAKNKRYKETVKGHKKGERVLTKSMIKKIKNGTIDIQKYNSVQQEAIKQYQEYYEKYLDANDKSLEALNELRELYSNKLDTQLEKAERKLNHKALSKKGKKNDLIDSKAIENYFSYGWGKINDLAKKKNPKTGKKLFSKTAIDQMKDEFVDGFVDKWGDIIDGMSKLQEYNIEFGKQTPMQVADQSKTQLNKLITWYQKNYKKLDTYQRKQIKELINDTKLEVKKQYQDAWSTTLDKLSTKASHTSQHAKGKNNDYFDSGSKYFSDYYSAGIKEINKLKGKKAKDGSKIFTSADIDKMRDEFIDQFISDWGQAISESREVRDFNIKYGKQTEEGAYKDQKKQLADLKKWYKKNASSLDAYQRKLVQKLIRDTTEEVEDAFHKIAEKAKDNNDNLNDVIDIVEKLVRQEREDMKDALDGQLDSYNKIIENKKKALQLAKNQLDYEDSLRDSAKEEAKLQKQIAALSLDDSRAAKAKRAELEEQLNDLLEERNRTVRDETYSRTEDALDDQLDKISEVFDALITKIDEFLDNQSAVNEVVYKYIDDYNSGADGGALYQKLIDWNAKYGDGLIQTVYDWKADLLDVNKVIREEGVKTIEQLRAHLLNDIYYDEHSTVDTNGNVTSTYKKGENDNNTTVTTARNTTTPHVDRFIEGLNELFGPYFSDTSAKDSPFTSFAKAVDKLTAEIDQILRGEIPERHHSGLAKGFTGSGANLKQHEALKILTDDELVLNRSDQIRLANQVKSLSALRGVSGELVSNTGNNINSNNTNTVQLTVNAPVTIEGSTSSDIANQLNNFGDDIANKTLGKLTNALRLNGVR